MTFLGYASSVYCLIFLVLNYFNVFKSISLDKNYINYILLFLLFSVVILAALTNPFEGDDLYRYNLEMNALKNNGLTYLFQYPHRFELITSLFLIIANCFESVNFLSILSVSLFYLSIFWTLKKDGALEKPSRYFSIFVVISASYQYLNELISGIRFPIAVALFLIILVKDTNRKNEYNLLYIAPVLVHLSSIILVFIMLYGKLMNYIEKNPTRVKHWEYFVVILPPVLALISHLLPSNLPSFLQLIFEKIKIYTTPSFYLTYIDWRVQCCMIIVFLVFCSLFFVKGKEIKDNYSSDRYYLIKSTLLLMIGLIPFPLIFNRLLMFIIAISFPLICTIEKLDKKYQILILAIIIVISSGLFCYRMVNAYHYWRFYQV